MEELLDHISEHVALVIEAIGILVIAAGSLGALFSMVRAALRHFAQDEARNVWLRYANWLVAGLTFQLAADIVHTTIAPTWNDVGKVAAIAAIRTFLTFFLDKDIETVRGRIEAKA